MTSAPDILDNDSETLSNISDENMCCVCKKLSLDAMHLLYTVEFVTWGQCEDATTGHILSTALKTLKSRS